MGVQVPPSTLLDGRLTTKHGTGTGTRRHPQGAWRIGPGRRAAPHRAGTVALRNHPPDTGPALVCALRRVADPEPIGTVPEVPAPTFLSRPLRSHGVATRPAPGLRAAAKTISRVDPAVVVPAATDPAVLVTLGTDMCLRLATLADETAAVLGDLAVVRLATGCIELAPADRVEPGVLRPLRVDAQRRLRLTAGLAARLCAQPGTKVLVTCDPASGRVMLVNLGTLAGALEAVLGGAGDQDPTDSERDDDAQHTGGARHANGGAR